MGLTVHVDTGDRRDVSAARLEGAVCMTLAAEDVSRAEISVALLDDAGIRALNRDHLGHDRPTDVLAFALWSPGEAVVGDVYVGYDRAVAQAEEVGVGVDEELIRLCVHGTLHVLGYDHPQEADRRAESEMYVLQEALVRRLTGSGE